MTSDDRITSTRRDEELRASQGRGLTSVPGEGTEVKTLRVDIEQTRNEMSSTVEAIEQKLNPEKLTDQAKDAAKEITDQAKDAAKEITVQARDTAKEVTEHAIGEAKAAIQELSGQAKVAVREATIGKVETMVHSAGDTANKARSTIVDVIRQNPVPAALTGLGLSWLVMNGRSMSSRPMRSSSYLSSSQRSNAGQVLNTEQMPYTGQNRYGAEQSDHGQGMVGEALDRVQETAGEALDRAQETAGQVAHQVQGAAYSAGSTAGDVGSDLMEAIKQNPVPAALAGLSLGWLFLNRPSGSTSASGYQGKHQAGHMAHQLQDTTGHAADQVQDAAGEMVDRVQQTTGRIADQAQETAGQFGTAAQSQAMRTKYRFEEILHENPLAVGAAALVLGAVVGLPVPQTRQEHQLMGQASSTLIDRAQSMAQETMDKVQHVAEEVQSTAQQEAQQQGLTQ